MHVSGVETYRARDGREIGLVIRADFDDFASHPPTFDTEEERAWLTRHYRVDSPELEKRTKAHVTADELPLQVTVLNRPAGAFVNPHYHTNEHAAQAATRHQVMVCLGGAVRIGLFATDGDHVEDVDLGPGDIALLYEGHSIETLEQGTRLVEVKQGPMPRNPLDDNVPLPARRRDD
jgi:hypothetical protein